MVDFFFVFSFVAPLSRNDNILDLKILKIEPENVLHMYKVQLEKVHHWFLVSPD